LPYPLNIVITVLDQTLEQNNDQIKFDELVKSRNMVFFVIPVKTGIQYLQYVT